MSYAFPMFWPAVVVSKHLDRETSEEFKFIDSISPQDPHANLWT